MRTSQLAAVVAAAIALLDLPGVALATPTSSQITTPTDPAFVTFETGQASKTVHVSLTTSGGAGDVDLRCYSGADSVKVAGPIAVPNGTFDDDVPITSVAMAA